MEKSFDDGVESVNFRFSFDPIECDLETVDVGLVLLASEFELVDLAEVLFVLHGEFLDLEVEALAGLLETLVLRAGVPGLLLLDLEEPELGLEEVQLLVLLCGALALDRFELGFQLCVA